MRPASGLLAGVVLIYVSGAPACSGNRPPTGPGTASGDATAESLGVLSFDPHGADFTQWINHFKDQVYRHWRVPQAAGAGVKGHADFQFTVERNGSVSAIRLLRSTGSTVLDRAARDAVTESSFAELPRGYKPRRVTMQVSFYYNEAPP